MQLGVASVLASMRNEIPGTVKFIFQPAEEGPPPGEDGGAEMMVAEGRAPKTRLPARSSDCTASPRWRWEQLAFRSDRRWPRWTISKFACAESSRTEPRRTWALTRS